MDLFEYQARDMFEAHGVPVLAGVVADTVDGVRAAATTVGASSGGVVVVKAQVLIRRAQAELARTPPPAGSNGGSQTASNVTRSRDIQS